jgi:diguanylate cyclase (GGDEF)-like protein
MIIWPNAIASPDAPDSVIGSVLRLLAAQLPTAGMAMLVTQTGPDQVMVADVGSDRTAENGARALVGQSLRVPGDLLAAVPTDIATEGLRLPIAWTMACGGRPTRIAASPVPGHPLHVLTAWCGHAAVCPDHADDAAAVIATLLSGGQQSQGQAQDGLRISALVRHLPVPLVFVDSYGTHVLINNEACLLLRIEPGEVRPTVIAAALAQLISQEIGKGRNGEPAHDRKADLAFEIRRGGHSYDVTSRWIDDGALCGRIWIFADVTQAKTLQATLARLASEDPLTGVLNRRSFEERIAEEIRKADEFDRPLALLILDLDHFKAINDTYGHQAGDQVLRAVCRIVTDTLREGVCLARIGGEEFAILLPDTATADASAVANRICAAIRDATLDLSEGQLKVTTSIGLAVYDNRSDSQHALLARSDAALYAAKRQGRDRIAVAPGHAAAEPVGQDRV